MRPIAATALVFAFAGTAPALGQTAPANTANCYVEVHKLMAIDELGAALRQLESTLRPQVEEISLLRQEIARLEAPAPQSSLQLASDDSLDSFGEARVPLSADANGSSADRLHRSVAELAAKQARLQADYGTRMRELVGPVQQRIGASAQAFGRQQGCGELKMARAADLGPLQSAGARDVTAAFVSWYPASNR